MGCWNGTCMISNLPINDGDEIKLVLIRKNWGFGKLGLSGGYVYSGDIFTPSFLPLSGKYNDYGNIKDIKEDWNYTLVEGMLKKMYGNTINVNEKDITDWTIYDFIMGIERGHLQYTGKPTYEESYKISMAKQALEAYEDSDIKDTTRKEYEDIANLERGVALRNVNASFIMVRADIWDHIIENYEGEFYDRHSEGYNTIPAKEFYRKEFDQAIKDENEYKLFSRGAYGRLLSADVYGELVKKGKKIREDIFKQYSELFIISSYLMGVRKGWMPQAGAGSQSECWEEYKILAEKMIEIADEKIKEYEEYD